MKINGEKYNIKFTFNSLIELEDLGISLDQLGALDSKPFSMIRAMLFVGIEERPTDMTLADVGTAIGEYLSQGEGTVQDLFAEVEKGLADGGFFNVANNKKKATKTK